MEDQNINPDTQSYLNKFHNPKLTALEFTHLLIAILKINNINSFKYEDIEAHIINCKKMGGYENLLSEITYRSNGIFDYSMDFEVAISSARITGLIYSVSPEQDSTVFINNFDEMAILESKKEFINSMLYFLLRLGIITEQQHEETKTKLSRHF